MLSVGAEKVMKCYTYIKKTIILWSSEIGKTGKDRTFLKIYA